MNAIDSYSYRQLSDYCTYHVDRPTDRHPFTTYQLQLASINSVLSPNDSTSYVVEAYEIDCL